MVNDLELDYLLGQMDEGTLKKAITELALRFKRDKVVDIVRDTIRSSAVMGRSDVIFRVRERLESFNEEIYFYANMKELDPDKFYSSDEASIVIAESIADEFYDRAELLLRLGLRTETEDLIRNIADGLKQMRDGKGSLLTAAAPDFVDTYCEGLLKGAESGDVLSGFGMKQ